MKTLFLSLCVSLLGVYAAPAEGGGQTLASSMDIYVFPKDGQKSDQQSKDEASCYQWAGDNTGNDPFDLRKQSVEQAEQTEKDKAAAQQAGQGAGARGALRGAAAGDRSGRAEGLRESAGDSRTN